MTMPHLMNCAHQGSGWCLACVKELQEENWSLEDRLTAKNDRLMISEDQLTIIKKHFGLEHKDKIVAIFDDGSMHVDREGMRQRVIRVFDDPAPEVDKLIDDFVKRVDGYVWNGYLKYKGIDLDLKEHVLRYINTKFKKG